jgi:hypothetical protein
MLGSQSGLISMKASRQEPRGLGIAVGSRFEFAVFLLLAYLAPPLLILSGVMPFSFRFPMLLITTGIVLAYTFLRGDSPSALGFRRDTLKQSLVYNLSVTLLALLAIAALHSLGLIRTPTIPPWRWFFAFYVLLSCPAQEFLFRSALFAEMDRAGITGNIWQVVISSAAYCFLHVIYRDAITMGVSLFIGIIWGLGFYTARNFWGVTVSHCILGTVSIFVGLI